MPMNQVNFLQRVNGLVTGDGFIREVEVPLISVLVQSGTAVAEVSDMLALKLQDDNDSIVVPFQIPLDYSESNDELAIVVTAELTTGDNDTNAIDLDLDVVMQARPGEDAPAALTVVSDSQDVAVTVEQYTFDLSSLDLKPGDILSIEIDSQETGTAEVCIYGVTMRYRSSLATDDVDFRSEVDKAVTN